jgi:hypothetical protein
MGERPRAAGVGRTGHAGVDENELLYPLHGGRGGGSRSPAARGLGLEAGAGGRCGSSGRAAGLPYAAAGRDVGGLMEAGPAADGAGLGRRCEVGASAGREAQEDGGPRRRRSKGILAPAAGARTQVYSGGVGGIRPRRPAGASIPGGRDQSTSGRICGAVAQDNNGERDARSMESEMLGGGGRLQAGARAGLRRRLA